MSQTVFIVEDDEAYAFAVARFLEIKGYKTIVAHSSMSALKIADDTAFDVALVDVFLKKDEPHGFALSRMLSQRVPKPSVIIITGHPDLIEDESEAYFIKDQGLDELLRLVEATMQKKQ